MALLGAGCTRCGQPYAARGITMLAQREGIAFVQLVCFACQSKTLALVTGAPTAEEDSSMPGEGVPGDLLAADRDDPEASQRGGRPIGEADVLEMHAFLAEYEGDIHGLLGTPPNDETDRAE
jgi:hypothetical protein